MALFGKKNANYISAKETKRISKENRKITNEIEKKRNRKNIPESEYITTMKNPENVVEFDNVHTYFFTVLTNFWFVWIPAGFLILLTVLGFNFVGDGLRDAFDPKMKR